MCVLGLKVGEERTVEAYSCRTNLHELMLGGGDFW